MNFIEAIDSGFTKYAQFKGRASRSEYWYWSAFSFCFGLAVSVVDGKFGTGKIDAIVSLLLILPNIAINARRLHDIDRSGWWQLLPFTIIGLPVWLYWNCVRGTLGPNRFGADPLESGDASSICEPAKLKAA